MRRRRFLTSSLGLGAGLLLPGLAGCGSSEGALDGGLDGGLASRGEAVQKGPFVQLLGPGRARLRFETGADEPMDVTLVRASGTSQPIAARSAVMLDYARRTLGAGAVPDVAGLHVLHELLLEDLEPGEEVEYSLHPRGAERIEGRFRAPVASGQAFRFGWIADTMFPFADASILALAEQAPDVVIHGGDIVYDESPFDSWNRLMQRLAPVSDAAAVHFLVGNHELEAQDEITVQYERLFAGQGDPGGTPRYFAFTYGAVRFLCLDTESGGLKEMDPPQLDWLDAELEAATASEAIREIIVGFHRPTYTLSKHSVSDTTVRERLHSRFVDHGVRLVFAGHAHAYERFVVDGIHYVVDGGGGALLYDPDEDVEEVESARPGEPALRVAVAKSHGVTVVDVSSEGALTLRRVRADDGTTDDEIVLPAL